MTESPGATADPTHSVRRHYDEFLARHYTWMCGDFEERVARTEALFRELGLPQRSHGPARALDLGCGSGIQTAALARLGFEVTGIDFNRALLEEAAARTAGWTVRLLEGDLNDLESVLGQTSDRRSYDVAVCMGDTLPHLPSLESAERMLRFVACELLAPGGRIVLGFRDQSRELAGADRIVPVRMNDAERVMLTFLEYLPAEIAVHDILLTRQDGGWTLAKSCYPKLRLTAGDIARRMAGLGLSVERERVDGGMTHLVLSRASANGHREEP